MIDIKKWHKEITSMSKDQLSNNSTDYLVSLLKGGAGAIPIAGGFIAELCTSVIPQQRIDRIAAYIHILEQRLSSLEQEMVRTRLSSNEGTGLLEESFVIAYRAHSDTRRRQIANIVAYGISGEKMRTIEAEHLLAILDELNDAEVIVLQSYAYRFRHYPFSRIHSALLYPEAPVLADPVEKRDSYAIRQNYDVHLIQLGMIKPVMEIDENRHGKLEVVEKEGEITASGMAFMRSIGGEVLE